MRTHPPLQPIVQCQRHRGAWYPKSHGCALCRAHELALKQADRLTAACAKAAAETRADTASMTEVAEDLESMRSVARRNAQDALDVIGQSLFRALAQHGGRP